MQILKISESSSCLYITKNAHWQFLNGLFLLTFMGAFILFIIFCILSQPELLAEIHKNSLFPGQPIFDWLWIAISVIGSIFVCSMFILRGIKQIRSSVIAETIVFDKIRSIILRNDQMLMRFAELDSIQLRRFDDEEGMDELYLDLIRRDGKSTEIFHRGRTEFIGRNVYNELKRVGEKIACFAEVPFCEKDI